jgi:hypothetical protein
MQTIAHFTVFRDEKDGSLAFAVCGEGLTFTSTEDFERNLSEEHQLALSLPLQVHPDADPLWDVLLALQKMPATEGVDTMLGRMFQTVFRAGQQFQMEGVIRQPVLSAV